MKTKKQLLDLLSQISPNLDMRMKILDYNLPHFKCKRRWGLHVLSLRIFERTIFNFLEKLHI